MLTGALQAQENCEADARTALRETHQFISEFADYIKERNTPDSGSAHWSVMIQESQLFLPLIEKTITEIESTCRQGTPPPHDYLKSNIDYFRTSFRSSVMTAYPQNEWNTALANDYRFWDEFDKITSSVSNLKKIYTSWINR